MWNSSRNRRRFGSFYLCVEGHRSITRNGRPVSCVVNVYLMYKYDFFHRFNICDGDVKETQVLCNELVKQVFVPALYNIDQDFVNLVRSLNVGLWSFNPFLEYETFMIYLCRLCGIERLGNNNKECQLAPTPYTKIMLVVLEYEMYFYQYNIVRVLLNSLEYISFWLIEFFPFLAFHHFGYKNSFVRILNNEGIRS